MQVKHCLEHSKINNNLNTSANVIGFKIFFRACTKKEFCLFIVRYWFSCKQINNYSFIRIQSIQGFFFVFVNFEFFQSKMQDNMVKIYTYIG